MLCEKKTLPYLVIIMILFLPRLSAGQFINGDFSSGLLGWETYGDVYTEQEYAVLRTGGIYGAYDTSLYTTFTVSGNSLRFNYYFDVTGPDDVLSPDFPSFPYDSFQVSLDAGNEGYFVETLDRRAVGNFVPYSMDISNISPGTIVTLSFDLIDQDDGLTSIAAIDNVVDPVTPVPEPETLILTGSGLLFIFISGRLKSILKYCLTAMSLFSLMISGIGTAHGEMIEENVDTLTRIEFASPVFNTRSNTLSLSMVVTNMSDIAIHTPLKVIITGISTNDVTVVNPDGYTQDGLPYFDLTEKIPDHELSPGEVSPAVRILFYNPRRLKFRWDQDILALVDVYTETGPVIENICLVSDEFPAICEFNQYDFEVEDPAFDKLLQRQLPEMYRHEQIRVYAYDYEELPVRTSINDEDAFYNNDDGYYYSDLILQEGLNSISIEVINETGMSTTRYFVLNIDTIPPDIEIVQPEAGSVVTSPEIIIKGNIDDPAVDNISLITNYINSEYIPVSGRSFETMISLQPGHNTITIEASDLSGNSTSTNIDIVYAYSDVSKVSGRIFNGPIGLPLSGAEVTMIPLNGDYMSVISGLDGEYSIDGVMSGNVTVIVEMNGYESKTMKICALGGDAPVSQDITLQPVSLPGTFTITGQIVTKTGHPVEGATVSVTGSSLITTSDNNGIYLISGIPRSQFEAQAVLMGHNAASINVDANDFSMDTLVLTHNFVLSRINYSIGIEYPEGGGTADSDITVVRGFVRNGDMKAGIRVNGVLANSYDGSFVANGVLLSEGVNTITAEMVNEFGIVVSDSIELFRTLSVDKGVLVHALETGIVPAALTVIIEAPPGIILAERNLRITGPAAAQVLSNEGLHYSVLINEPGIYTINFNGADSGGNNYTGEAGFIGMAGSDADVMLKQIWNEFKDYLADNSIGDALSMILPETRGKYEEQFIAAEAGLSDFISNTGDIQLVMLSDNIAKARVYRDDVTYYIWFARDIYGIWKIHKF